MAVKIDKFREDTAVSRNEALATYSLKSELYVYSLQCAVNIVPHIVVNIGITLINAAPTLGEIKHVETPNIAPDSLKSS